jgi:hypothetical protein
MGEERKTTMKVGWRRHYKATINQNLVLAMNVREEEILMFDVCKGSTAVEGRMATAGGGMGDNNNGNAKEERRRARRRRMRKRHNNQIQTIVLRTAATAAAAIKE